MLCCPKIVAQMNLYHISALEFKGEKIINGWDNNKWLRCIYTYFWDVLSVSFRLCFCYKFIRCCSLFLFFWESFDDDCAPLCIIVPYPIYIYISEYIFRPANLKFWLNCSSSGALESKGQKKQLWITRLTLSNSWEWDNWKLNNYINTNKMYNICSNDWYILCGQHHPYMYHTRLMIDFYVLW